MAHTILTDALWHWKTAIWWVLDVKYLWLLKKITKTSRVVENGRLLITASHTVKCSKGIKSMKFLHHNDHIHLKYNLNLFKSADLYCHIIAGKNFVS